MGTIKAAILSAPLLLFASLVTAADVVVVVSPENPATAMTKGQVANLFLGRSYHFPNGNRVRPVDQTEGEGMRQAFYRELVGWTPAQLKSYWSRMIFTGRGEPPRMVSGDDEVKDFVASHPGGIGYISEQAVDDSVKVLELK